MWVCTLTYPECYAHAPYCHVACQALQFVYTLPHKRHDFHTYKVSQEECARLWEDVPYVKVYRYNPKHLYPQLNGYGDNGQRSLKL